MESAAALERAVDQAGIAAGSRVLVAVSGGPDSVALLDTLHRLSARHDWALLIGHVNHGLRGEESDADERFVRDVAAARGLKVEVARLSFAAGERVSEADAREARYATLQAMLGHWNGDLIATGHTADDQAETFLLRLLRGSGVRGLASMSTRRDAIIRPFLGIRRETIVAELQDRGLGYRLDSTNQDPHPVRNQVRSHVVPALTQVQPQAVEMIGRAAANLRPVADFLRQEADRVAGDIVIERSPGTIQGSIALWRSVHPALRHRVLERLLEWLHSHRLELDVRTLARATTLLNGAESTHRQLTLPGTLLQMTGNRFTLRIQAEGGQQLWEAAPLPVPSTVHVPGGEVRAQRLVVDGATIARLIAVASTSHALCNPERVDGPLVVRRRTPGDRLRPLGAGGSRKVQDILVDRHVPASVRDRIPIVADARGVVWVAGHVLDERCALSSGDGEAIHLAYRPSGLPDRDTMRG